MLFSILAITCVIVGGGLLILLSFTLDSILSRCFDRQGTRAQYSKLERASNEAQHLQG